MNTEQQKTEIIKHLDKYLQESVYEKIIHDEKLTTQEYYNKYLPFLSNIMDDLPNID